MIYEYYHDNILEFEDTFKDELKNHGINLKFLDSKSTIPLQIVDNIASIFRHAYDKTIMHFKNKEQWENNSEWDLKLMSKIQRKISISHIKYTVPFCDWSLLLCVEKCSMISIHKNIEIIFILIFIILKTCN